MLCSFWCSRALVESTAANALALGILESRRHSVVSWNMLEWWDGTSTIFNLMHCPVSFVSLIYASANVYHFVLVVLNLLKWTLCPIACKVQALAAEDVETGAVGGI